jgi:DNA-binding transcriptional LysR family regulator
VAPSHRIDPRLLPTFLAVFESGRVSAAAKALHLSQPAVTAQVRKLEDELGAPLFVRSAAGVTPTAAGERLAGYARTVQRLLGEAAVAIAGGEEPAGELDLAASTTIAAHLLPLVLARFRASHPTVRVRVAVGNTEEVIAQVKRGRVPIGLVEGHARASGIHLERYVDDEIVPVSGVRAGSAIFRVRKPGDLAHVPILWREPGSGTRAVVERALRRAGIRRVPLAIDLEIASTEAILGAAMAGLGVAFASRWAIQTHLASGRLALLPGLDLVIRRTFRWATAAGALTSIARAFHDFAQRNPPVPTA